MSNEDAQPAERVSVFMTRFRDDLNHWIATDRRMALKVMTMVEAVMREPFEGIGMPEQLRHRQPGTWSRRLSLEHRLVYLVEDDRISFLQAGHHY